MDTPSQLELERVRERNRIAKRKSRARQRQKQQQGAPQGPDPIHPEPSVSPFDSCGIADMFGNIALDNDSHSWIDLLSPGDTTEDDGVLTPSYNQIDVASALTPTDDPLHLPHFRDLVFAPRSSATDETAGAYIALPSNDPSTSVAPLYMGYQQECQPAPLDMSLPVAPDSNNALDLSSGSPSSPRMLHLAVRNGSIAIARALLVAGASVNARDDTGALPLHLAVQNRRRSVADLLLRHGADPNGLDKAGTTPLELAVRSQDEDMVRLLLSRGARVE